MTASALQVGADAPFVYRSPATQLEVIDSLDGLLRLEQEWNRLLQACPDTTVFQTFEWQNAWLRAFGQHDPALQPFVIVVRSHGLLRGLAPLMLRGDSERRTLTFLGAPYADYHSFLIDPASADQTLAAIWRCILDARGLWQALDLDDIQPGSALLDYLRGPSFRQLLPQARVEPSSRCFHLDLRDTARVGQILQRHSSLVKLRRLSRQGQLSFVHHTDRAAIAERFPHFTAMHRAQWQGRPDGFAGFEEPHVAAMFGAVADALASRGWMLLSELTLDERPVAFFYSFAFGGAYWGYRPCFDVQLARYSPGSVMMHLLVEHLAAQQFHTLDLMRGEHAYKLDYTTSTPHNRRLILSADELR